MSNITDNYDDVKNDVDAMQKRLTTIRNNYLAKISILDKKINDLQNNGKHYSKQYIEDTKAKLQKELDDVKKNMDKKINAASKSIADWQEKQLSNIKSNIIKSLGSKLGISPDEISTAEKLLTQLVDKLLK